MRNIRLVGRARAATDEATGFATYAATRGNAVAVTQVSIPRPYREASRAMLSVNRIVEDFSIRQTYVSGDSAVEAALREYTSE